MRIVVIAGLLIAFVLAIVLSPFASSSPDGLEKVGEDKGFIQKAHSFLTGLIPDYLFPGIKNEKVATAISGGLGVLIVFGLTYGLAIIIRRKSKEQ